MIRFTRWTSPFAIGALVLSTTAPVQAAASGWKPRAAKYGVVVEKDVRIRMSDGLQLVADVFRPAHNGKAAPGRFPVIVSQTPYNKVFPGANMVSDYLVKRGYVQVSVDVRGTGGSPGVWNAFAKREQLDGKEIVEWAGSRPWSDGRIGLFGASYGAINQIFTAAQRPKGLKAIFPVLPMGDAYRDVAGTGGQLGLAFVPLWMAAVSGLGLIPPSYRKADPKAAEKVIRQHLGNITSFQVPMIFNALAGGDKAFDSSYYRTRSPLEVIDRVNVPAFIVGGEFDIFQRSQPLLYQRLAKRGVPSKFVYGPWYHVDGAAPALGLPFPGGAKQPGASLQQLALRWYDKYVRGVPIKDDLAPVTYYENGSKRWKTAGTWPPASVRYRALNLSGRAVKGVRAGALTWSKPSGGPDKLPWAPLAGLCTRSAVQWTTGVGALLGLSCATDQRDNDKLGLTYDLKVRKALHLAGPVNAHLWVSSKTKDGALTVRVEDVAPSGKVTQLSAGWQMLSLRKLDKRKTVRSNGMITQPYHPYTKRSIQATKPGKPVPVDVEIYGLSGVIKPGHRLRVSIQTGDFPHVIPNFGQLGESAGGGLKIWHDPAHRSWVALPVQTN